MTVVLTAVVAFVVGVGAFALLDATVFKKSDTNNKKNPSGSDQSSVASYDTYTDLHLRANLLLYGVRLSDQSVTGYWPVFQSITDLAKPSVAAKATFANNYAGEEYPTTWEKMTEEEYKEFTKGTNIDPNDKDSFDFYQIHHNYDITKTAESYKKLFGEELDLTANQIHLDYAFPGVALIYVPSLKAVVSGAGGGSVMTASYGYHNNIVIEDNKAYVYFNFFTSQMAIDDIQDYSLDKEKCHDDFEEKHEVACADFLHGINNYNYKTLKNYRLVFEDDGTGNYVYKTAEEVK